MLNVPHIELPFCVDDTSHHHLHAATTISSHSRHIIAFFRFLSLPASTSLLLFEVPCLAVAVFLAASVLLLRKRVGKRIVAWAAASTGDNASPGRSALATEFTSCGDCDGGVLDAHSWLGEQPLFFPLPSNSWAESVRFS